MYRTKGVLALLVLYVGLVQSFSWDIVVARSNRLEFYNEGLLVHTATPASHRIKWLTYDPVNDRVLFAEKYNREDSASSFDIENKTTQSLIKKKPNRYLTRFAYDPATELLFGTISKSIYSFPLGYGNNNEVNGDLVITLETIPREVAVDSCGANLYWTTKNVIERALFNGSEREVIIDNMNNLTVIQGLTVDSQKIYWIETQEYNDGAFSIESADLDGSNKRTLYSETESYSSPDKLTVSKDFISWEDSIDKFFWQLLKNPSNDTDVKPIKIAMNTTISSGGSHDIAANYKIEERTQLVPNCDALLSILPDLHVCVCQKASAFCVHGTKIIGQSRCDCIQGYIGGRCDISVCENYCLQGDCNVTAEGQPKCRCNAGYTGERCDTSVCENYCLHGYCNFSAEGQPKCRCNAGYTGERCDTSICENYCLNGDCNVSAEGQPKCRCDAGYTGERCDTSVCENYCLHGDCNVSAEGQPKCRCNSGYTSERCDTTSCENYCLHGYCNVSAEGQPKCRCNAGYTGERCDTSICENYCLNGDCNVSAEGQPKCRCNAGYKGERCVTSICENYCLHGDCNVRAEGQIKCRCNAGYTGERCDTSVCENYCLHGDCNVSAEGQPKCRCDAGYTGERCDTSVCENYCLHGDCNVSAEGQPKCRCNSGFTGKRCDTSICENYCLHGDCNVSAEGQIKCRCNAGYTGERCDTSVCENYCLHGDCNVSAEGQPKCRCDAGYTGERCDTSVCENYCLHGDCNVSAEGQPKCRCDAGYTDERCDTSICENYCLHGDCNVSAEGQPKCGCNAGYTGERCDIPVCENYCLQGDCNVIAEGQPKCRCNAGYSGMRCDVNACYKHCQNDGVCFLNEEDEPVCQCTGQYEGDRCDVKAERFHWLPMVDGKLPPDAITGGFEREHTYVARAYHDGSQCPGKYIKETDTAYFPWFGKELIEKRFEILCGVNAKWVKTDYDNIPANAFVGGRTGGPREVDGEPLYICRNKIKDSLVCGKAYAPTKKCYLPYYEKEIETSWYEILVEE